MLTFHYTAVGPGGDLQQGTMEAVTEAEVIARLQRQGSMPMRATPATAPSALSVSVTRSAIRGRLRKQEIADLVRELATMLAAGQDLEGALRYSQETAANARVLRVIAGLRNAVRDGNALSTALEHYPGTFTRLHIGLVQAGEAGGNLAESLSRLASLLDRQRALAATITSALVYPSLLLIAAICTITLLLTQVLPQFVSMFEQNGATLPASTYFLIGTGDIIANYGIYGFLVTVGLVFCGRALLRLPRPRTLADHTLLLLPVAGPLLREMLSVHLNRVLGTLLVNGVSLISALAIVREASTNLAATRMIDVAETQVRNGGGLTDALAQAGVLPVRTIHLLRLGERNAQLGASALRAADIHEEHVRLVVQRLVALLVPAMTVALGIIVAGIVASLLTAMLSLNDLAG